MRQINFPGFFFLFWFKHFLFFKIFVVKRNYYTEPKFSQSTHIINFVFLLFTYFILFLVAWGFIPLDRQLSYIIILKLKYESNISLWIGKCLINKNDTKAAIFNDNTVPQIFLIQPDTYEIQRESENNPKNKVSSFYQIR